MKPLDEMMRMGAEHGRAFGTWVDVSDETTARYIKQGYEDGLPEVMDLSGSPLSGEYADGPFIPDVLEEAGLDRDYAGDDLDDLLNAYEEAFYGAFWSEVWDRANYMLNADA